MTVLTIIRTFSEILAVLLVAYAIYREEEVRAFEAKLIRAIKYYRHKALRRKAYKKIAKNRSFVLTVNNSSAKELNPDLVQKEAG
ncbi:MAG: hypothetical protein BWY46_01531 [Firmicutes bacterium ADurb.Bin300]|nr:MAG: hypothetical protein BWY46_01531 [Firmicutes bacterium ADurb.Bin300]